MKCPECHTEVNDNQEYCPNCGSPLPHSQHSVQDDEPTIGRGLVVFIIIGTIFLVAFASPTMPTTRTTRNIPRLPLSQTLTLPTRTRYTSIPWHRTPQPRTPLTRWKTIRRKKSSTVSADGTAAAIPTDTTMADWKVRRQRKAAAKTRPEAMPKAHHQALRRHPSHM